MQLPELEQTIFETILGRRSVRSFTPKKVEADVLNTLLEAAVWAPTALH
jgi:nitroreductase